MYPNEPVITVIASAVILKEKITVMSAVGTLLVMAGLLLSEGKTGIRSRKTCERCFEMKWEIKEFRRQGIAREMMKTAMDFVTEELKESSGRISAQLYLKDFYTELGFEQISDIYQEGGIDHISMIYEK